MITGMRGTTTIQKRRMFWTPNWKAEGRARNGGLRLDLPSTSQPFLGILSFHLVKIDRLRRRTFLASSSTYLLCRRELPFAVSDVRSFEIGGVKGIAESRKARSLRLEISEMELSGIFIRIYFSYHCKYLILWYEMVV